MISGVVGLAACGGGGGEERSAERTPTTAAPTTTTETEHRIDVYEPIPGGSLHGTPRPPLENTGDDYVAIFESIDASIRWLVENPDPALVSELYLPGSAEHDNGVALYSELTAKGWRALDEDYRLISVEQVDAREGSVVLRVTDHAPAERFVDRSGAQVGEGRINAEPSTWSVVLAPDDRHWKISDWAPIETPVANL